MKKQVIKLTEGQLRQIIKESVKRMLTEEEMPGGTKIIYFPGNGDVYDVYTDESILRNLLYRTISENNGEEEAKYILDPQESIESILHGFKATFKVYKSLKDCFMQTTAGDVEDACDEVIMERGFNKSDLTPSLVPIFSKLTEEGVDIISIPLQRPFVDYVDFNEAEKFNEFYNPSCDIFELIPAKIGDKNIKLKLNPLRLNQTYEDNI